MKLHRLSILALLMTTACPGSDPVGSGTDASSSSAGDTSSTDASVTLTTTTASSMSATGMTMTGPTTDPTSTTDDPTGTTDEPTGTTEPTGTEETTEPTTTEPADTGSSSTGEPPGPVTYDACDLEARPDMQCAIEGDTCWQIPSIDPTDPVRHWCGIACENGDPSGCPEPTSGDATVECSGLFGAPCALSCADGETCPDGMVCYDAMINGVMRCVWETDL